MKRDNTLDYLRGFAILSIVIGHLYFFADRATGSILWNICNSIQIPIFIYVSGLLAGKSILKYSFKEFLKNRFIRLIIPFISFFILWLLFHGITIENTVTFFTTEFKQGFWFLEVLFELMLILAINKFISRSSGIHCEILDFISFIIINAYHFLAKDFAQVNQVLGLNLLWHYYPIFLIGIYSHKFNKLFNTKLSFLYLLIYAFSFYLMYIKNIHMMLAVCNLSSLFFFVTVFSNGYKIAEPAFIKVGQFSMEIYLLHILAFDIIGNIIPIIENRCIEAVVYILLACIICYLFIGISSILKKSKTISQLLFGN
jgi:Fucose 4-O-acetylase and related acetyltransferases